MSATIYHLECEQKVLDIQEFPNAFKKSSDMISTLVGCVERDVNDAKVLLLNFEKFYFRNNSTAALTVMITQVGEKQTADIIGSGGGNGLLNISMGANSSFAYKAKRFLEKQGFVEIKNK